MSVKQDIPTIKYGNKVTYDEIDVAGDLKGTDLTVGSLFLTIPATFGTTSTTPVSFISGGFPVAGRITYIQLLPANNFAGVIEVASSTNTKGFVIKANTPTTTAFLVMNATSILNAAVSASEDVKISSTTGSLSATVVIGFVTAN